MKRTMASPIASFLAIVIALTGTVYAQSSPSNDIRESNDPDRAAEVERKARAISGQSFGGSGNSDEPAEDRQPSMPSDDLYGPSEERSEGESGESEGGSGLETPEEGYGEGDGDGSGASDGKMRDSSPPYIGDPYY